MSEGRTTGVRRPPGSRSPRFGFTVIEVMVAVLLLAVSVASIFGAQFAAVATADYSQGMTQAVQLARCRMNELELQFQIDDGFEEGDVIESGPCCEVVEDEEDIELFECSWEIKMIEFPDVTEMLTSATPDGGVLDDTLGTTGSIDDMVDDFDPMGMVATLAPMITELLRAAIRKVTVKVEWEQGARHRELEVTQYVTHPTQGPLQLMQQASAADQLADELLLGDDGSGGGVRPDGSGGGRK
jgi:prepilin-type N-terminal cleavage/methylation domain-containing protein